SFWPRNSPATARPKLRSRPIVSAGSSAAATSSSNRWRSASASSARGRRSTMPRPPPRCSMSSPSPSEEPPMSRVTEIRYVGYGAEDFDAERRFYADDWGLEEVAAEDGMAWFKARGSAEHHVVRLHRAETNSVEVIAL